MGIFSLEGNFRKKENWGSMKKVTRFLVVMMAAILTVISFHATDLSLGSVQAKGENYLDPYVLSVNTGYQSIISTDNNAIWYVFDLPQDGDLKLTITGNAFIDKFTTDHDYISSWETSRKNEPFIRHISAAAGRYYLKLKDTDSSAKVKIEFTSFGFKAITFLSWMMARSLLSCLQ